VAEPVVVEHEVECAGDPCSVWRIVADTDRVNRAVGMKKIQVRELAANGSGTPARFLIRTQLDGWMVEYEEYPSEWVENEYFLIRRQMRRGPLVRLEIQFRLRPHGEGTKVGIRLMLLPRFAVLNPLARFGGGRSIKKIGREIVRADAARGEAPPTPHAPADEATLTRAAAALRESLPEAQRALADRLVAHVRDATDHELVRLRPFELARLWGADRGETLTVCLAAVLAGLLEMSWELVCPSCRTGAGRAPTLADVAETGHCQLCDLTFGVELDRAVEATFSPAPGVRAVDGGPYCIAGPARTPHVVAQGIAQTGKELVLRAAPEPGRYRLFARGGAVAAVEAVAGAPAEVAARLGDRVEPERLEVAPGGAVRVTMSGGPDRHVKLERSEWASSAATGHHVSMNPLFRRQFSGELLRPGVALKVGRAALLFSDLTASTALYHHAGDGAAFGLVQDHFELLRGIIERRGGTLVKTIGDAVMAAFLDDREALGAAVEMQRAWPPFRGGHAHCDDVWLKLGVYAGPTYAVTANGLLDYFGQSVNIAARLQAAAEPAEIVVPDELATRAEREGWLGDARVTGRFEARLKGLAAPVPAARIAVQPG
jgi:class 3 adenylate cyclase